MTFPYKLIDLTHALDSTIPTWSGRCGYIPDGKGVTYNYEPTVPGNNYPLDDDLVLWFLRKLK